MKERNFKINEKEGFVWTKATGEHRYNVEIDATVKGNTIEVAYGNDWEVLPILAYQVELVDMEEDGEITASNSWGDESEFFSTLEEATEEADRLANDWHVAQDWDAVLINKYEYQYDMWETVVEIQI